MQNAWLVIMTAMELRWSPPLKFQFQYFALPDITCPNQDHVLAERPNGKLACITNSMAEKTGWHVHHKNMVDTKGEVLASPGAVSWISFEITWSNT